MGVQWAVGKITSLTYFLELIEGWTHKISDSKREKGKKIKVEKNPRPIIIFS